MRSHFYALSVAAVMSMPVWAQQPRQKIGDPCPILFGDSYKLNDSYKVDSFNSPSQRVWNWRNIPCSTTVRTLPKDVSTADDEAPTRLAAVTITELRTLIGEIRGLRAEMREYQQKLAQARADYDAAIKATMASQESWRTKALNDTLESVEKMPVRLALNKNLRTALLSSLKEELPKDQGFIDKLRQHTTP